MFTENKQIIQSEKEYTAYISNIRARYNMVSATIDIYGMFDEISENDFHRIYPMVQVNNHNGMSFFDITNIDIDKENNHIKLKAETVPIYVKRVFDIDDNTEIEEFNKIYKDSILNCTAHVGCDKYDNNIIIIIMDLEDVYE